MQPLSWYLNRMTRMSPAEVVWRTGRAVRGIAQHLKPAAAVPDRDRTLDLPERRFVHIPTGIDLNPYLRAADRILRGEYTVFELDSCQLGTPPHWNRDPRTGRLAPLASAASLDYRDERRVGDIKYLWEPNRHLHLATLAQAYALTRNGGYADEVLRQIDSWIEQCPPGRGPNWTSPLELGIRLINWSLAWQWLGGAQAQVFATEWGRQVRERWLESVFLHAQAIANNLSRFSSANNHLIGEAAGVWIASVTWPYWRQMRLWGARCRSVLAREALLQNTSDGANREQALAYQQFVLDFLLLAGLAARACQMDFDPPYWARIERMMEFMAALTDAAGNVPMIGDADDGYVVSLAPEPDFCPYRSLVATGARLFARADFSVKAGRLDAKTHWLLGEPPPPAGAPARFEPRREFREAGYYLLGDRFETEEEVRMLIDAGPLGYLSLAAHGHADALALMLNVGGHEVLIDPGTYAYHTQTDWRRYFRSTRAHNTVSVDGADQSEQAGNFMWIKHAHARCLDFLVTPLRQRFCGEHDGYARLEDPLIHRREVDYDAESRTFDIADVLTCQARHRVSRNWHFSEKLQPQVINGQVRVKAGRFLVVLTPVDPPQSVRVHRGGSPEEGGWISRRFGRKTPSMTVMWESTIEASACLRTRLTIVQDV